MPFGKANMAIAGFIVASMMQEAGSVAEQACSKRYPVAGVAMAPDH